MCSVLNHCAIQYRAHERFSWPENYSVCRPSCAGWCVAFFLSQAVTRVGRMFSVAVCLGFRVPFSFTLISVILLVDLRGIFIVRACHHLWGYTGPDEFSAIETGWRNQWPFNMAPHFLNIGFRFISWWLRYIHFNLIQEFPVFGVFTRGAVLSMARSRSFSSLRFLCQLSEHFDGHSLASSFISMYLACAAAY